MKTSAKTKTLPKDSKGENPSEEKVQEAERKQHGKTFQGTGTEKKGIAR